MPTVSMSHTLRLGRAWREQSQYFARLRVPVQFRLLEDRPAIDYHLKTSTRRRNQLNVRRGVRATNLGRQTGGPRCVVSKGAILDGDFHGRRAGASAT
jgi:hypothetical protein